MHKLFFKVSIRYLLKNKFYSFINIFGLIIGITSFTLIMFYVNYERSYDKFEGSEEVYRVYLDHLKGNDFVSGDAETYNLSGPTLKQKFPEVLDFVRFFCFEKLTFRVGDKILEQPLGSLVDSSYFNVFNYPLLKGEKKSALNKPYSIVLSESFAKKLFGDQNPLQKLISAYRDGKEAVLTVTGVMKDIPKNSHYRNTFLISYETEKTWTDYGPILHKLNWDMNNYYTYIKIDQNTNESLLRQKIIDSNFDQDKKEYHHNIEPIGDIHLHSNKTYEVSANGSATRIKFLMAIAFFILILSWLNYINLSTTKSLDRAKEIGICKVAGAQKSQLFFQSLIESVLLNFMAIFISFILVAILLPIFSAIDDKESSLGLNSITTFLPYFLFVLFGVILAGLYPALLLSSYSPKVVLKGRTQTSLRGLNIRKGLIIIQFLITIVLLIGTIIVMKQINFLESQPIGANINQIIALKGEVVSTKADSLIFGDFKVLQSKLKKLPFIEKMASAQTYPGDSFDNLSSFRGISMPDGRGKVEKLSYTYYVQPNYFDLMDIEFVTGGTFLPSSNSKGKQIVVNETFLKSMGISSPEEILNKSIGFWDNQWKVTGVIKDYYHFGLKSPILPIVIRYDETINNLLVKLNSSSASVAGFESSIARIRSEWIKIFPNSTFNYTFLDQKFEAQYRDERNFRSTFQIFTIMAILIASMGLFGLTFYTVVKRKKEIGVRKVIGASIADIIMLLNKDFVKLLGISFVIAVPISWYAMNQWLQGFAYRTTLSWWVFAIVGILTLLIAMLTVSWQSFKAAIANPVNSLRNE